MPSRSHRTKGKTAAQELTPDHTVIEAKNVVLAKIAADLNFDQFERYLARIGETVNAADWNICRLILVDGADFVSHFNLGRTSDDHPVLGTMKVLLQRESRVGLHNDPFHLIA